MPCRMGDFQITDRTMRYSDFVPRFYNLCKSYGFEAGRIMPSRAFCSDENQGYPIILITKHFGTFPFNHGRVGGIVATSRHGPHAHHGRDLVIIQASHVGYDPETGQFGAYRRLQIDGQPLTASCGKIGGIMQWYRREYAFASDNIGFSRVSDQPVVLIDNHLLDPHRETGLFLKTDRIVSMQPDGSPEPVQIFSTAKAYPVHPDLQSRLPAAFWRPDRQTPIGDRLTDELFYFKRPIPAAPEGADHLEQNLSQKMPYILTAAFPALAAAQFNTQIEFDRTYRTIIKEAGYQGKNLVFIAGVHIDISPEPGQLFPLTKFVPWAAYVQTRQGRQFVLEQNALFEMLDAQSTENPDKVDLTRAIHAMKKLPTVKITA